MILIIAPIGKMGGRELETGFIAQSLAVMDKVEVLSISTYEPTSQLLSFKGFTYTAFSKLLLEKYPVFSFISKLYSVVGFLKNPHKLLSKPRIKRLWQIEKKKEIILKEKINGLSVLIICGQVYSNYIEKAILIAKKENIPVVFRTTGTIFKDSILNKSGYLELVDHYIHHSQNNANSLLSCYKHSYTIIDQCAYNEEALLQLPIQKRPLQRFFVLSRLSEEKQIENVILAFKSLNNSKIELHVYGEGPERKSLEILALGHSTIKFHGPIPFEHISTIYKENDCLLISSSEEAGPQTGVEAMAAGIWIISTKVGAMPERYGANPMWYDGSVSGLKEKMEIYLTSTFQNSQDYRLAMRRKYKDEYSLDQVSNRYLDCVSKVIKNHSIP